MSNLTLINSNRSTFGTGLTVDTYRDEEGNGYTAIGGSAPVRTLEADAAARAARRSSLAREAGIAARAGDWDKADALMAEARAI